MSIPTSYLQTFIASVPTVTQTSRLATVLEIFRQGQCDQIVLVSERQSPLGIISLRNCLPYLINGHLSPQQESHARKDHRTPVSGDLDPQQPLWATGPPLIQPLTGLSASLSLNQLWPHLQAQSNPDLALVDAAGKFLGLLDRGRLLKFLAEHLTPSLETGMGSENSAEYKPAFTIETSHFKTLNSLIQLLERLPLPLCVQSNTGEIVTCNLAWSRQFSEFPGWETTAHGEGNKEKQRQKSPEKSESNEQEAASVETFKHTLWQRQESTNAIGSENAVTNWSQLDLELAASLGVCSMPTGQEKVWQFVKMPLGIALPKPEPSESAGPEERMGQMSAAYRHSAKRASAGEAHSIGSGTASGEEAFSFFAGSKEPIKNESEALNTHASGFTSQSEERLWLVLAEDVTEHQQVAKELAGKNADLVQLNRLKDEFLACISHELKTPLTAVLGLSSLLKDRSIGELNERQARYARLIYQSGRHLMTVVNDILDLTRIETGQMELIVEPVNITNVCDRAFKQAWQQSASERQDTEIDQDSDDEPVLETQFSIEIEPGLETLVADELRLRQMLVHLLSNAFKFTEPTGATGLKVSRWEGWIAFTVWDTGIGIANDKQHLIFQKFQQLENPLTRRFEGAGLGLVLTQRLARQHGGDVTFVSKEAEGSQFTLLLPPCPPQPAASREEPAANRHRLVLIVETVPRFIEELTEQLSSLGYRVVVARAGTEALEKARRFSPEVIFLNPVLPLLSGWDVLTLLKSDAGTCHIPVIVTATQAEKELATQNSAEGFLTLPVQPEALRHKLTALTQPKENPPAKLTVLRLCANSVSLALNPDPSQVSDEIPQLIADLNSVLHRHHYRVLEADDLEQAELLARVWHPDVVLLDTTAGLDDPLEYLQELIGHSKLASLPLVTLDRKTTQAANQVTLAPGGRPLQIYPWLGSADDNSANSDSSWPALSTLLQVIQIADGRNWKPSILVVDVSTLPDLQVSVPLGSGNLDLKSDWQQALIQYIQTAGFRGLTSRSWAEVLQQLQNQSIDLLLIYWREPKPESTFLQALANLNQLEVKPPILVLTQQSDGETKNGESPFNQPYERKSEVALQSAQSNLNGHEINSSSQSAFYSGHPSTRQPAGDTPSHSGNVSEKFGPADVQINQILKEIATQVLPSNLSMAALLEQINQTLRIPH
ncbi:ATP-binding protein [Microcoleus sp. FACHB-68]|uniref:ATP-binding protein n=1 Tax=Microcoleus sp. FACHB-68 TaxID=2692826 RepID=UPI0016891CF2|nr:ATP-binding protein [Microcoleus sp. FACHB-68]MBD1937863.1 response regulator [Microcoleus sp. FACHB-68]